MISENNQRRFGSRREATKRMGPLFILLELFFYLLGSLSLITLLFRLARHVYGVPEPKLEEVRYDGSILFYFVILGVALPIGAIFGEVSAKSWYGWIGAYIVLNAVQEQGNTIIFDQFRANRLPKPRKWIESKGLSLSLRDHEMLMTLDG